MMARLKPLYELELWEVFVLNDGGRKSSCKTILQNDHRFATRATASISYSILVNEGAFEASKGA